MNAFVYANPAFFPNVPEEADDRRAPHEPVLVRETLRALAPAQGELFVDGTLGFGGHTRALLEQGAHVIGIDQDPEALAHARGVLRAFGERFQAVRGNFRDVERLLAGIGIESIDGALLDLGVSSWQIDRAERGFSFQQNGPLDMRLDPSGPLTASDLLNQRSEEELADIFWRYGDERASRRIAAAIVRERITRPLRDTFDLVRVVGSVLPRHGKRHPATRVFQALRIAVNDELLALDQGLEAFARLLQVGGRLAVITFHSIEDRLVKNFFRETGRATLDRPEWPEPKPNPRHVFRVLFSKPIEPGADEVRRNPRARSARLRAAVKIHEFPES